MRKIISSPIMIIPLLMSITPDPGNDNSSGKLGLKLNPQLEQALLQKLTEKEKGKKWWDKWWEWVVPLVVSILLSGVAYWFSWQTYNRDKKYKDIDFVAEIDKLVLEHPELGAYEDAKKEQYESSVEITGPASIKVTGTEKLSFKNSFKGLITALDKDVNVTTGSGPTQVIRAGSQVPIKGTTDAELKIENNAMIDILPGNTVSLQSLNDKLLNDKIDAFLYYKLNNFEMALNQPYDESARECWEEYLAWLYRKSTRFNRIIQDIVKTEYGDIYDQDFIKQVVVTLVKKGCDIQIPQSKKAKWNIK